MRQGQVSLDPWAMRKSEDRRRGVTLRARLRAGLAARGLGGALEGARGRVFGASTVTELELVLGDWYQSAERAEPIESHPLGRVASDLASRGPHVQPYIGP